MEFKQNNFKNDSALVRDFIFDIGMPLNKVPEALSLSAGDFMNWWAGRNDNLVQYCNLLSLSHYLSINPEHIIEKTYDKNYIRSSLLSSFNELPEQYSENQYSYVRSSAHIIKLITMSRGQYFCDNILKSMKVNPLLYQDLNNKISLNFFVDLLEKLAEAGFSQSELDLMACSMFLSLENTPLGQRFRQARSYYDCYEIVANNMFLFDSNFEYSFELKNNCFEVKAFLNFDKHYHVNWKALSLERIMRYRFLAVGWFPYLSNLPPILPICKIEHKKNGIEGYYILNFNKSTNLKLIEC